MSAVLEALRGVVEDSPAVATAEGGIIVPRDLPNVRKHINYAIRDGLLVMVRPQASKKRADLWRLSEEGERQLAAYLKSGPKPAKAAALTGTNLFVLGRLVREHPGLLQPTGTVVRIQGSGQHERRLIQLGALEFVEGSKTHLRLSAEGHRALLADLARERPANV